MASFVFNIAKGRAARLAQLPETNDALIAVLLSASEAQSTMEDYDDLAALLAGANTEAAFTGYSRQTLTSVVVSIDDTGDQVTIDCDDPQWSPTSEESLSSILICYDSDTTAGDDSGIVPLVHDDFVVTTPTSGTVTYNVNASGFYAAS